MIRIIFTAYSEAKVDTEKQLLQLKAPDTIS